MDRAGGRKEEREGGGPYLEWNVVGTGSAMEHSSPSAVPRRKEEEGFYITEAPGPPVRGLLRDSRANHFVRGLPMHSSSGVLSKSLP